MLYLEYKSVKQKLRHLVNIYNVYKNNIYLLHFTLGASIFLHFSITILAALFKQDRVSLEDDLSSRTPL